MVLKAKIGQISQEKTDAIYLGIYEEDVENLKNTAKLVDDATDGMISELLETGDFRGELNDTALLYTRGVIPAVRLLLAGLGSKDEFELEKLRQVSATVVRRLRDLGIKRYSVLFHDVKDEIEKMAQALAEGTILGHYQFAEHKTENLDKIKTVDRVELLCSDDTQRTKTQKGLDIGKIIAEGTVFARDLSNHPANVATPSMLAREAKKIAKAGNLKCEILSTPELEEGGFQAILAVAKGSYEDPKFIILEYNVDEEEYDTVVLAGKGVTFDSGGISIKSSKDMEEMKHDMSGAAAVLGAMQVISKLKPPLRVIGLIAATENMPGGEAQKPGDVIQSLSDKTIEVINTDAEGRLVLADALAYATRYKPSAIIDLATLTGAVVTALGHFTSGMMGTSQELMDKLKKAGEDSGERTWPLPLWDEYDDAIKSDVADVKNVGDGTAGSIIGGAFLKKFVEDYPWVHLDIAGTAWLKKEQPYSPKGGTGFGVRLLVEFLRNYH